MSSDEFSKQVEFYSNAIVGFFVIQNIGFCYQFGTSMPFNKLLHETADLSIGLAVFFVIQTVFGVVATYSLSRTLQSLNGEHAHLIKPIFRAKAAITLAFGLLPCVMLLRYATLGRP